MISQFKKLIKYFLFLFILFFLVVNWNDVHYFFDYHFLVSKMKSVFRINNVMAEEKKQGTIEISKISVSSPIVFLKQEDNNYDKALREGVLLYPSSSLPGKPGITIILGHSAPENYPDINYDTVFSNINNLVKGDKVVINFNNKKYVYLVQRKYIIEKGGELLTKPEDNKNTLVLLSCWPPGRNLKRIAVEAKRI